MARRPPTAMSKLERARELLVRGAVDDQDFRDMGLDPEEGRRLQDELLADAERTFSGSSPEKVFAKVTVEVESHISALAEYREALVKQRQHQVAIGAVKAAFKIRRDWVEMGQDLGLLKRAQGGSVNFVAIGDSALKTMLTQSLGKQVKLLKQMDVSLEEFELPALGSPAPDMLSPERVGDGRVLDASSVIAAKREVVDEPFPGD